MGIYTFNQNFLWGSAFSGPQTESASNVDGKSDSIWDYWFKKEKFRFYQQKPCLNNFYYRYEEDIDLASELNFNSLRTSIQWSRLIPDGTHINQKAIHFYNNVINKMIKNKIQPIINLFHFDMPYWAQEKGGFLSREIVDAFVFYAQTCFKLFGDRVKWFATFNEPIVVVEGGYLFDWHFPNEVNMKHAMQVQWNMLIAHLRAVQAYKNLNLNGKVGCILNISPIIARSKNPRDLTAARWARLFTTDCFLEPMVNHIYPDELKSIAAKHNYQWDTTKEDEDLIANPDLGLDFLGLNYYQPARVQALDWIPDFANGVITPHFYYQPYSMPGMRINPYRGWEIFPQGIYQALMDIKNNYNNIPVYISENGMGVADEEKFINNQKILDQYRIDFVKEHLYWVNKAIQDGVNCFGYHSWAYIDNWSWLNGYKNRYGFIQLDLANNCARVKKQSANFISDVCKTNQIKIPQDWE